MTPLDPASTPVPERSLNRQIVLDEDEYTAALSQIIARDFFPSLVHLDATNDYLDALNSRDPHLINASVRRLAEISSTPVAPPSRRTPHLTPSQTPYNAGPSMTPMRTPRGEPPPKRARYDTGMSLDTFQARYTSEDNSSFTQILDEENRKRKEKWAWAWDAQKRVEAQREKLIEARERMLIEAPPVTGVREKFMIEVPTPAGLITDNHRQGEGEEGDDEAVGKAKDTDTLETGKEVVFKGKEEEEDQESDVMAPKKDNRTAGVDGWRFKVQLLSIVLADKSQCPSRLGIL